MSKDTLKNRIRFSTTLSKEANEKLKQFSNQTMVPISKLIDIAISMLVENGIESKN